MKENGNSRNFERIWLFSANKIKSSESFSKYPTQLIVELNSSLQHIIVTNFPTIENYSLFYLFLLLLLLFHIEKIRLAKVNWKFVKPLWQLNLFILFEENSQMVLKIYVIPLLLTSMYVYGSTKSVIKQPTQLIFELNSSLRNTIVTNGAHLLGWRASGRLWILSSIHLKSSYYTVLPRIVSPETILFWNL